MTTEAEIKKLADNLQKAAAEIKSEVETVKKDQKSTAEWNTKLDSMITKLTEAQDAIQVSVKSIQDRQAQHEALLARRDIDGSEKKADEVIVKSKEALRKYMLQGRDGVRDSGFKVDSEGAIEIRAMSTDSNADGGYLVLPEVANFMVTRQFETSPMRRLATVIRTGSKELQVTIDDNESGATWVGEGIDTVSSTTTPQIGLLRIVAHKIAAQPAVSVEMLEDPYVDVEMWLKNKIADKFTRTQNTAFVSGTGVSQPRGFLSFSNYTTAGVYERGRIERINLGSGTDVTADGLINLQASLKEIYQGNATWVVKRASYANIIKQKGSDNYYFGTTLLKDGQLSLQLLGRPLTFADDMPAIAGSALAVAYGDFAMGYTIVDRVGLSILKDPYTSKGMVSFYSTARAGGDVTNYEAIKLGNIST